MTMDELAYGPRDRTGYQLHHIVEQTPAEQDGFPRSQIDGDENLVYVPTLKHYEISAWYQTGNDEYGGLSPREYLRDKNWDERFEVGKHALQKFGVLKP
jgi:hypothetical protein